MKFLKQYGCLFTHDAHLSSAIYTNLNDLTLQIPVVKVSKDLTQASKDLAQASKDFSL
ncbi:hypothetical protein [Nostoc commune]|uniref:hypothetical protein n=1 Tax=Nostoc commune TaxID=1178 RepID=UPI0018C70B85|nr:hypothetical protein [Nostoc commune]